jgi:DNA-directed RNA polymerase subunit RPC12/RpoP
MPGIENKGDGMNGVKISTWADIANHKWDEHDEDSEQSFRRGYYYAISDVIDAFARGLLPRQLMSYCNGILFNWAFQNDITEIVYPPEMPESWNKISARILKRDGYVCHYCGKEANTTDHKTPVTGGGADEEENLVAACKSCNSKKHTKSYYEFINQNYRR